MPFVRPHVCLPEVAISVCAAISLACQGSNPEREAEGQADRPAAATESSGIDTGTPARAADAYFDEVAEDIGVSFVHVNGSTGRYYYSEMMGSGAALFDFDQDGDLDLYLVQGSLLGSEDRPEDLQQPVTEPWPPRDRLYRNDLSVDVDGKRSLHMTDVTEDSGIRALGYGMGVLAFDANNDGWPDLYLTNAGDNQLWINRGDGTFEDRTQASGTTEPRWSVPAVALDYDRDGFLDLFVGNYLAYTVAGNKRCTDELGQPNYCGPLSFPPLSDTLLRNRGDGTFENTTLSAGLAEAKGGCLGAVVADFDGDGWLDIFVANDGVANALWMNQKDGTFAERALFAGVAVNGQGHPEASMGVVAVDADRDGDEDLFVTHLSRETNTFYRNDGMGVFADHSSRLGLGGPSMPHTGFGTGFLDLENDGRLDLLVVNGAVKVIKEQALAGDPLPLRQPDQLYGQGEDGRFEALDVGPFLSRPEVSRGAAFGDLDQDGDTDAVVTSNGGAVRILLNRSGQDQAWIGVRLLSGKRDAHGARAVLYANDELLATARVGSQASYGSSSDPRLHFGLANLDEAVDVLVHWGDGARERFAGLDLKRYHTLVQGTGQVVQGTGQDRDASDERSSP